MMPSPLRERFSGATPRPWEADPAHPRFIGHPGHEGSEGEWDARVGWTDDDEDAALIVAAVNEYEPLRGLAQYAKHLYGCARIRTNGGLHAPGECDCGLDDWLAKWKAAAGER
jgi:hypothetical protein